MVRSRKDNKGRVLRKATVVQMESINMPMLMKQERGGTFTLKI